MANLGAYPHIGSSPFRFSCSLLLFLVVLALAPCANSQATDQVHLRPPTGRDAAAPRAGTLVDADLTARTKPLRVDVDLVLVPVTVTDAANRPVSGLEKLDFALYEDNKAQQIRYFSTEDAPISVGVILDLSGTMSNKIDTAREAVAEFFKNAHPEDDYFVVTFSNRPKVTANTTQSIGDIQARLATVTPAGYTALLDAIYLGVTKLRSARYQRRALLIISDGGDNNSRYNLREIKRVVEEADVEIYAIGIFDDSFPVLKSIEEKLGKRLLTQVTEATGGRTIAVENVARVPQIAAAISRELRNQYLLGYRPSNVARNGKWRKIRVRVTPKASAAPLQAYYRKGYLAPEN